MDDKLSKDAARHTIEAWAKAPKETAGRPKPTSVKARLEAIEKLKAKARKEFKAWKAELIKWVRTESMLEFCSDGSYRFIIPSKIVKLVWATTIEQRVVAEMLYSKDPEAARKKVLDDIKKELEEAQSEFYGDEVADDEAEVSKGKSREEILDEERKAKKALEKLREEMVKMQGG
jgi:hypothetical protein